MNRLIDKLLIISLFFCLSFNVLAVLPLKKVGEKNIWMDGRVSICAHRGGALLNPENTKKAFDYVIKETRYTDIVELDLRLTKDNVIIINHDSDINRMAFDENIESYSINAHTYEELLEYNLGRNFIDLNGNKSYYDYSILRAKEEGLTLMSIEQFLNLYNGVRDVKVFLEIKENAEKGRYIVDQIANLLEEHKWWKDKVMIISFDDKLIDYIWDKYPDMHIGALGDKVGYQIGFSKMGLDFFYTPNYHSLQIPYNEKARSIPLIKLAGKKLVYYCHKRNQSVTYWGVNEKEGMEKLINIGADVITTDRPDLLAELLKKK